MAKGIILSHNSSQPLSIVPLHYLSLGEGGLDINQALVVTATEAQLGVALIHDEGTVDKYVELPHGTHEVGFLLYLFPGVACIAPHIVAQLALDAVDEMSQRYSLRQRVTAGERHRSLVIGYHLHEFIECTFLATILAPRFRIMASRTMVAAARQINRRAQAWTIHAGALHNV